MKAFNLNFTNEDIGTIMFCIDQFKTNNDIPTSSAQKKFNDECLLSASRKLILKNDLFSADEYRMIYSALLYVHSILDGSSIVNDEIKSLCLTHQDSIEDLLDDLPDIVC